jgi:hypothetical protein
MVSVDERIFACPSFYCTIKERLMKPGPAFTAILAISVVLTNAALPEIANANSLQKTGTHGGSVSATTTQKGNKVTASGTATGRNGKTAKATGTATVLPGKVTATGAATGPNGGTASGNASMSNGTVSASGTATGKNGHTASGSVTAKPGTATLTSGSGASKTVNKRTPPQSP